MLKLLVYADVCDTHRAQLAAAAGVSAGKVGRKSSMLLALLVRSLLALLVQKYKYWQLSGPQVVSAAGAAGTQFTCFTTNTDTWGAAGANYPGIGFGAMA